MTHDKLIEDAARAIETEMKRFPGCSSISIATAALTPTLPLLKQYRSALEIIAESPVQIHTTRQQARTALIPQELTKA